MVLSTNGRVTDHVRIHMVNVTFSNILFDQFFYLIAVKATFKIRLHGIHLTLLVLKKRCLKKYRGKQFYSSLPFLISIKKYIYISRNI